VTGLVLLGFGVISLIAGLLVARRRSIAILGAGVGVLFGVASVTLLAYVGRGRAALALTGGVLDREAADAIVEHVTAGLRPVMLLSAVVGVVIVVASGVRVVLDDRRVQASKEV
jgi:hypothetical protein